MHSKGYDENFTSVLLGLIAPLALTASLFSMNPDALPFTQNQHTFSISIVIALTAYPFVQLIYILISTPIRPTVMEFVDGRPLVMLAQKLKSKTRGRFKRPKKGSILERDIPIIAIPITAYEKPRPLQPVRSSEASSGLQSSLALPLKNLPPLSPFPTTLPSPPSSPSQSVWGSEVSESRTALPRAQSSAGSSVLTKESVESSLDSDILSISDFSEDTFVYTLELEEIISPIIQGVVNDLLSRFRASRPSKSAPANGESSCRSNPGFNTTISPASGQLTSQNWGSPGNEGLDQFQGGKVFDKDGEREPSSTKGKQQQELQQKLWACPFWKWDPVGHASCFTLKLHTVTRVKQHLTRKHTLVFFCPRCRITFGDLESQTHHVMLETRCAPNPSATLDGILPQQQQQLSRKSNPALSEADKWFAIWDIALPGKPRPGSPYIDTRLSQDCSLFQEYAMRQGPELLIAHIESSSTLSITALGEEGIREALRRILSQGVNSLVESWIPSGELSTTTALLGTRVSARSRLTGSSAPNCLGSTSLSSQGGAPGGRDSRETGEILTEARSGRNQNTTSTVADVLMEGASPSQIPVEEAMNRSSLPSTSDTGDLEVADLPWLDHPGWEDFGLSSAENPALWDGGFGNDQQR